MEKLVGKPDGGRSLIETFTSAVAFIVRPVPQMRPTDPESGSR
jgi:hypothetical protein